MDTEKIAVVCADMNSQQTIFFGVPVEDPKDIDHTLKEIDILTKDQEPFEVHDLQIAVERRFFMCPFCAQKGMKTPVPMGLMRCPEPKCRTPYNTEEALAVLKSVNASTMLATQRRALQVRTHNRPRVNPLAICLWDLVIEGSFLHQAYFEEGKMADLEEKKRSAEEAGIHLATKQDMEQETKRNSGINRINRALRGKAGGDGQFEIVE